MDGWMDGWVGERVDGLDGWVEGWLVTTWPQKKLVAQLSDCLAAWLPGCLAACFSGLLAAQLICGLAHDGSVMRPQPR